MDETQPAKVILRLGRFTCAEVMIRPVVLLEIPIFRQKTYLILTANLLIMIILSGTDSMGSLNYNHTQATKVPRKFTCGIYISATPAKRRVAKPTANIMVPRRVRRRSTITFILIYVRLHCRAPSGGRIIRSCLATCRPSRWWCVVRAQVAQQLEAYCGFDFFMAQENGIGSNDRYESGGRRRPHSLCMMMF